MMLHFILPGSCATAYLSD